MPICGNRTVQIDCWSENGTPQQKIGAGRPSLHNSTHPRISQHNQNESLLFSIIIANTSTSVIMNLTQWYGIALGALFAFLLLYRTGSVASHFLIARFSVLALKHVSYPLLFRRRYYSSVSRIQATLVCSYFLINGFSMGLGIKTRSDLMIRSGVMASINIIPLFLGGRTSVLANFVGISLHTYYIGHHWVGRIVILQGILYVGLAIASGTP